MEELQFPCFSLSLCFCHECFCVRSKFGGISSSQKENSHFLFNFLHNTLKALFCSCSSANSAQIPQEAKVLIPFAARKKPKHCSPVAFCIWRCWSSNAIPALILLWKFGVSCRTWTSTFQCDFCNCPWHVKVVLRAWVLCQRQPVGTPQHHSATGDCLLPWHSSKMPGIGDYLCV